MRSEPFEKTEPAKRVTSHEDRRPSLSHRDFKRLVVVCTETNYHQLKFVVNCGRCISATGLGALVREHDEREGERKSLSV